jgi:hypothetical protein
VAKKLSELQAKFEQYRSDEAKLLKIIASGNAKAAKIANAKLQEVKQKVGLL